MITNKRDASSLLLSKGIKPTYPRTQILEYLWAAPGHPTVDSIYQALVKKMPTMSKTTVYNTLKTFLGKGVVSPVKITGTEVRLDANTSFHHHFLCEECGVIYDIDLICPHALQGEVKGHRIRELHGHFVGTCAACRGRGKQKKEKGT